ncbi:Uu.00g143440.m01.CDS01 [Anthostomella pinea]|uniref:Uu.00g143440.m01.CDS01 n=1 Tax=Anthostomella pinea TaxID=933095 RepID=A0AAI8YLJ2_9PEZI|nr:Uu.00g143440.m01.CDS01 [Anthostomella pinea]
MVAAHIAPVSSEIKTIEPVRQRIFDLDQELAAWEAHGRKGRRFAGLSMPASLNEALRSAEELAELLKKQGLEEMELCKTYRDCSNYCHQLGDVDAAIHYAQKELDIERCIMGMEAQHLRDGMHGAEY